MADKFVIVRFIEENFLEDVSDMYIEKVRRLRALDSEFINPNERKPLSKIVKRNRISNKKRFIE